MGIRRIYAIGFGAAAQPFASRLTPTFEMRSPVGVSLLAMAVVKSLYELSQAYRLFNPRANRSPPN
jgi:hypothetical protein